MARSLDVRRLPFCVEAGELPSGWPVGPTLVYRVATTTLLYETAYAQERRTRMKSKRLFITLVLGLGLTLALLWLLSGPGTGQPVGRANYCLLS